MTIVATTALLVALGCPEEKLDAAMEALCVDREIPATPSAIAAAAQQAIDFVRRQP